MPFSRSAPAYGSGNTGHIFSASSIRKQMNALTAYLDASQVYNSDDNKAYLGSKSWEDIFRLRT